MKIIPDDDFSKPRRYIYGSPFRPSIGPSGELMPPIIPLDLAPPPPPPSIPAKVLLCKAGHELRGMNVLYVIGPAGNRLKRCRECADKKIRWVAIESGFEVYDGKQLLGVLKKNQLRGYGAR